MRAAIVIVAMMVSGCTSDGRPIRDWSLDYQDKHGIPVRLPSNLLDVMPPTGFNFTLHTEVAIDEAVRGKPATLVLACYHTSLALTVDGEAVPDEGDVGVGEHRYVISSEQTRRGHLSLTLAAPRDLISFGFTVEPRLVAGVAPTTPSAIFNRALGVVELVLIGAFSLLYGLLYLLDRRRLAEGWFVVQTVAALGSVLTSLGIVGELFGDSLPTVFGISLSVTNLALLAYISHAVDLGRPSRWWIWIYAVVSGALMLALFSAPLAVAMFKVVTVVGFAFTVHVVRKLWVARQRAATRIDATLLIAAQLISVLGGLVDTVQIAKSHNVLGGIHVGTVGLLAWAIAQAIVLARRHVGSERDVERLNAELRHQVAQRSSELVSALDQLAKREAPRSNAIVDGRYRIIRELGAGGMGTVHEVTRVSDGARFALKLVRGAAPEALARFAREAQIAAEQQHANVLAVLDVGTANGTLYLVMPLVDGGSLEQQRARFGDTAWARPLLAGIARGLAALHARGVVHRDLKPSNILVADGVPKIADFGLATMRTFDALGHTTPEGLTRAGDVIGTPRYMAPELATGIRDARPSSDIFSFGLIANELLTGKSEPDANLLGIDPIIARCLERDPTKRPTASELAAAFENT